MLITKNQFSSKYTLRGKNNSTIIFYDSLVFFPQLV